MPSTKPFKLRHFWMSTQVKSIKRCTVCGCIKKGVSNHGITETHYELNGDLYIGNAPNCKH